MNLFLVSSSEIAVQVEAYLMLCGYQYHWNSAEPFIKTAVEQSKWNDNGLVILANPETMMLSVLPGNKDITALCEMITGLGTFYYIEFMYQIKQIVTPHVKQVIVWRNDLKCRMGKKMAQVSHASLAPILNQMYVHDLHNGTGSVFAIDAHNTSDPFYIWKNGSFTKICLRVDSEAELLELYEQLKSTKIPHALITDNGLTEFDGVPTHTCLGIGPWYSNEIDPFTKHLKLM